MVGPFIRMKDDWVPKKALSLKHKDCRKPGRPKVRLCDDVEEDPNTMGTKRWRLKLLNREE